MYALYHSPYSQHARRVVSLLEAAGLPYELRPVDMMADEHLSPAYLAVNPNHQVPTLVDGDFRLHESNAILRYLSTKHALTDWYPEDLRVRARIEQWLDWNQTRLSPAVVDIVLNTVFLGDQGHPRAIERGKASLADLAAILEARLEESDYLVSDRPTIADLSLASNIFHLGFAEAQPNTPAVASWFARVSALEGFQKSLPQV